MSHSKINVFNFIQQNPQNFPLYFLIIILYLNFRSNNTPVSKKGKRKPNLLEKWISNSATKKGGGKGKSSTPGGKSLQREKCPECSNLIAKKNFIRHKLTCSGSKGKKTWNFSAIPKVIY